MVALIIVIAGPLPWALANAAAIDEPPAPVASRLVALLTTWCVLETAVAIVLGFVGAFHLRAVGVVEASLCIVGVLRVGHEAVEGLKRLRPVPTTTAERALLATAALAATMLVLRITTTPITDFDSLAYHLPVMAKWYQTQRFAMLEEFYTTAHRTSYYPHGWEALSALFILPFGEDLVVALPNVVAWLLFAVAVYATAVAAGAGRVPALAFALLVATAPIVRKHVTTMHVDLALAAYFMAGIALALGPRTPARAVLFVATLGLVCGTKTSGPLYAAFLLAAWIGTGGAAIPRPSGAVAVVTLVAAAIVGLSWYARNVVVAGNPLGFVRLEVGGWTVFPGSLDAAAIRRTTLWQAFDVTSTAHWRILLEQTWLAFRPGLPIALVAAWGAGVARGRERAYRSRRVAVLAALIVGTAVAYWMTPTNVMDGRVTPWIGQGLRFAFPLAGLLAASGAIALSAVVVADTPVALAAAALSLVGLGGEALAWAAGILLTGAAASRVARTSRAAMAVVVVASVALVVVGAQLLRLQRSAARRVKYRGIVEFVDEHGGSGAPVAYVFCRRSYVLAGAHLDRRVVWMPAGDRDREAWIAELRRAGIGLVAIGPLERRRGRRSRERAWLADVDGPFVRVFGTDDERETVLYRLDGRSRSPDT